MPPGSPRKAAKHRKKPDPIARKIGERIKRLRSQPERDFNFDSWVEEVGLGRGHLDEIEKGLVSVTILSLVKIAKALDLTLSDLVAIGGTKRERLLDLTAKLSGEQLEKLIAVAEEFTRNVEK